MHVVVDICRREWYADGAAALANGVPQANLMQIEVAPPAAEALIFLVRDADGAQEALADPEAVFLWGHDRAGVEVMTFAPAAGRDTVQRLASN